jgi:hypothetical protein
VAGRLGLDIFALDPGPFFGHAPTPRVS